MNEIKLSIIIVNYKVRDFLAQAIRSIVAADNFEDCEIIVVDNKSEDGSKELINRDFPFVKFLELKANQGFGKACNIGAKTASGKYLLMLNPDTIISKNTLSLGIDFLEKNKDVGILGPKILNQDGSFQFQCRRSFPTPLNAFFYISGLSKIFAKNKTLGSYNLSWVSSDEECDIDAVSGACFFIPKNLFLQVGGFDEKFFMYGEDLDLSAQVKSAGFRVHYTPQTEIIHFKGKSSAHKKLKSRISFYEAMILFSKKHNKKYGSFFPKWLLYIGVLILGGINIFSIIIKNSPIFLTDLFFANIFLPISALVYGIVFKKEFVYFSNIYYVIYSHIIFTTIFIASLWVNKHYDKSKPKIQTTAKVSAISFLLLFAVYYAFQEIAYSRIIIFSAGLLSAFFLVFWRALVSSGSQFYKNYFTGYGNVVLLAEEPFLTPLVKKFDSEANTQIIETAAIENLDKILAKFPVNSLVIGSKTNWYPVIIKLLSERKLNGVSIFWLPPDSDLNGDLKLNSFTNNQ